MAELANRAARFDRSWSRILKILTLSNCQLRPTEGSGQIILALSEGLRLRGHQVDLHGPDDYEVAQGLRPRGNTYRQTLGMLGFVRRALARRSYDLVEIYGGDGWLTFEWLARRKQRPHTVSHSNGLETHYHETLQRHGAWTRHWWQLDHAPLMRRAFRKADGLITLSDFDRAYALRVGYQSSERVVTVCPGLHPAFHDLRFEPDKPPVVGFCGSWLRNKGIEAICTGLPDVLRAVPEARVLLVGVGAAFRPQDWFPAELLHRVDSVPWVEDREELVRLYQRMAVALMPSFYESFGLVAGEAMACSAAVIVSQTTGIAGHLEDGTDAVLLQDHDPGRLAMETISLLKNEKRRRAIAQSGHRRAAMLRWERSVDLLDSTYARWFPEARALSR